MRSGAYPDALRRNAPPTTHPQGSAVFLPAGMLGYELHPGIHRLFYYDSFSLLLLEKKLL
jgi:hypothetical protein